MSKSTPFAEANILESLPHAGRITVEIVATARDDVTRAAELWRDRHQGYDATLDGPPQRCTGGWIVTGRRWSRL